jgi:hypothetical protein
MIFFAQDVSGKILGFGFENSVMVFRLGTRMEGFGVNNGMTEFMPGSPPEKRGRK